MKSISSILFTGLFLSAALGAGCNKNTATEPSTSADTAQSFDIMYSEELAPRATGFYSFSVQGGATVSVTLASVSSSATGALLPSAALRVALGVPAGSGCGITSSATGTPGFSSLLQASMAQGVYCVSVTDTGSLAEAAKFVIRITLSNGGSSPAATTVTETFASTLPLGGTATRTITTLQPGPLTVALQSVGPPANVAIGFGIGIVVDSKCTLTRSLTTPAGAQFSLQAEAGTYCVMLTDIGNLTAATAFTVSITRN